MERRTRKASLISPPCRRSVCVIRAEAPKQSSTASWREAYVFAVFVSFIFLYLSFCILFSLHFTTFFPEDPAQWDFCAIFLL